VVSGEVVIKIPLTLLID